MSWPDLFYYQINASSWATIPSRSSYESKPKDSIWSRKIKWFTFLKKDMYKCGICGHKAVSEYHLQRHVDAKHENRRAHPCPHCDYRSGQRVRKYVYFFKKTSWNISNSQFFRQLWPDTFLLSIRSRTISSAKTATFEQVIATSFGYTKSDFILGQKWTTTKSTFLNKCLWCFLSFYVKYRKGVMVLN